MTIKRIKCTGPAQIKLPCGVTSKARRKVDSFLKGSNFPSAIVRPCTGSFNQDFAIKRLTTKCHLPLKKEWGRLTGR